MSAQQDGGPAFPHEDTGSCAMRPGMSLRDYFAVKAMQAFISRADVAQNMAQMQNEDYDAQVARWSYESADAMLKARQP